MTHKDRSDVHVRKHYWLVAGNVVVQTDGEGNSQALPANGTIVTDEQKVGVHQLGKAQQALQISLFQKLGATMKVVDVILISVTHLGQMTDAEWNWKPEGAELRERASLGSISAEVIDFTSELNSRG